MGRLGLLVVALLAVLGGVLGWVVIVAPELTTSTNAHPSITPPALSASPSDPPASTPPPPAVAAVPTIDAGLQNQAPAATAPARITVASLGVDVPVIPVGLDPTGAMALPPDPAVAGWYQYGPAPANPVGATVIAAHVDSLVYGLGPFAALADAAPGTEIVLTDAAGQVRRYAIASQKITGKVDVAWASVFDRTGPARLVLVTCGGEFDYSTRHYLSNVIVTATPLS
jgi:hypothetical protein